MEPGSVRPGRIRQGVFIERDGILNEAQDGPTGKVSPRVFEDFRIKDEAIPLVKRLKAAGLVVIVVALPLVLLRRIRISSAALPFVVVSGVSEVVGFTSFALGARHGIAVSAVLASQFAAVAAAAAFVLFHERLRGVQVAGIATIAVCVAVLSAIRA